MSEFLVRSVQFRVTSVQNNRGSGHRLNNGTGESSIFYIIKVSQPKVHHGSVTTKGAAGEFFKRGFKFYRGWLAWVIYLNVHRHLNENDFQSQMGGGGGRGRVNHTKPLCNRKRSVTLKSTARESHKQKSCQ